MPTDWQTTFSQGKFKILCAIVAFQKGIVKAKDLGLERLVKRVSGMSHEI